MILIEIACAIGIIGGIIFIFYLFTEERIDV